VLKPTPIFIGPARRVYVPVSAAWKNALCSRAAVPCAMSGRLASGSSPVLSRTVPPPIFHRSPIQVLAALAPVQVRKQGPEVCWPRIQPADGRFGFEGPPRPRRFEFVMSMNFPLFPGPLGS
jgi:hypothetical protein